MWWKIHQTRAQLLKSITLIEILKWLIYTTAWKLLTFQYAARRWGFPGTKSQWRSRGLCSRWSQEIRTLASRKKWTSFDLCRSSLRIQNQPFNALNCFLNHCKLLIARVHYWEMKTVHAQKLFWLKHIPIASYIFQINNDKIH